MQTDSKPSLFARDDTFLGVCQGLGEDLGVSPDIFRVAMIPALFFFPVWTIAGYLAAGLVVLVTRLLFPVPTAKSAIETPEVRAAASQDVDAPDQLQMAA